MTGLWGRSGFNLIDGCFYIFKAKATTLANGSCNYKVKRMWHSGCGDGIAAAYRAGAEIRNAEFGNFFDVHWMDNDGPAFDYTSLYNALGEEHLPAISARASTRHYRGSAFGYGKGKK